MPEIQHFIVTQTRKVEVSATSMGDACDIAREAFTRNVRVSHPEGRSTSAIKITRLEVDVV